MAEAYSAGTLAGTGSFTCVDCGFPVSLLALDPLPECPNCGGIDFRRAHLFERAGAETGPLELLEHPEQDSSWVEDLRGGLEKPGHYLAFMDCDRVSLVHLTKEWTRIGRSMSADLRLDDPTVSRRHALIVRQPGGVRVLDDRSLNGVWINGERVEWSSLADGDELQIGRYAMHFIDTLRQTAGASRTFEAGTAA